MSSTYTGAPDECSIHWPTKLVDGKCPVCLGGDDFPKAGCSICLGTRVYINSRGLMTSIPCNLCDPDGWDAYLKVRGIR